MSRVRIFNFRGQDDWHDEGPSSIAPSKHIGGEQIVAPRSGPTRLEAARHLSNAEWMELPRCGKIMPVAQQPCARPAGHGWDCMTQATVKARNVRKRAA